MTNQRRRSSSTSIYEIIPVEVSLVVAVESFFQMSSDTDTEVNPPAEVDVQTKNKSLKKKKRKLEQGNETPAVTKKTTKKRKLEEPVEEETAEDAPTTGKSFPLEWPEVMESFSGTFTVSGGNLTSLSFESLLERGVSDLTLKAINEMKLTTMTEIQAKSIGPLLEGR